jgi:DNA-binding PadR family transcriptional regulator
VKLEPLDFAVLAAVGSSDSGVTQYDLKRAIEAGTAPLLGASVSGARKSLLRLAGEQYVDALVEERPPDAKRETGKTRYTLNLRGRTELERWAKTPARLPTVNTSELQARIRAMPSVGAERTLVALYETALDLQAQLDVLEWPQVSGDSDTAARLEFDLLHALYWTYLEWLDRAIRDITVDAASEQQARGAQPRGPMSEADYNRGIQQVKENVYGREGPPAGARKKRAERRKLEEQK